MAAANHQLFVLKPLYLDVWKTCLLPSFNLLPDFHTVKCTSPSCSKTQSCHLCTSHLGWCFQAYNSWYYGRHFRFSLIRPQFVFSKFKVLAHEFIYKLSSVFFSHLLGNGFFLSKWPFQSTSVQSFTLSSGLLSTVKKT